MKYLWWPSLLHRTRRKPGFRLPTALLLGLLFGLLTGGPAAAQPPGASADAPATAGRYRLPVLPASARPGGPLARMSSRKWRLVTALTPPVTLLALGCLTREPRLTGPLDSRFDTHHELQEHYRGFRSPLDDYTRHVPTAAVFGLSLAGVPARHGLPERVVLFGAANLLGTGVTSWLKRRVRDARPYDPAVRSSFPSYHTTQAFVGATVLAEEYGGRPGGGWLIAGGYAMATATGVLRLLNNQHWSSDVLVGAGIGILSTELVYTVYPVVRRCVLGGRSRPLRALVVPTLPGRGSALGVAGVWLLR